IEQEVTELLQELLDQISDSVVETLLNDTSVALTLDPDVSVLGGTISSDIGVTIDTTIAQLLDNSAGIDESQVEVTGSLTISLPLVPDVEIPIGDFLGQILDPVVEQVLPALGAPLTAGLENLGTVVADTVNAVLDPVLEATSPVMDVLDVVGQ